MTGVHPTAIVSDGAEVADDAEIGPYAVIEAGTVIGSHTQIGPHSVVRRYSRLGAGNRVDAHVIIGGDPQHTRFEGGDTRVEIGDNNVLREGVTVNRAFEPGAVTRIGSGCYLMANSHVGHDCVVGDNVILTNGVLLGGHVEVGRNAVMGGNSAAHQFTRVGAFSMVAGFVPLRKDVLPYTMVGGEPVRHYRLNSIGLRRNGIDGDRYRALERAFRALARGAGPDSLSGTPELDFLAAWLAVKSKYGHYGFARPSRRRS